MPALLQTIESTLSCLPGHLVFDGMFCQDTLRHQSLLILDKRTLDHKVCFSCLSLTSSWRSYENHSVNTEDNWTCLWHWCQWEIKTLLWNWPGGGLSRCLVSVSWCQGPSKILLIWIEFCGQMYRCSSHTAHAGNWRASDQVSVRSEEVRRCARLNLDRIEFGLCAAGAAVSGNDVLLPVSVYHLTCVPEDKVLSLPFGRG